MYSNNQFRSRDQNYYNGPSKSYPIRPYYQENHAHYREGGNDFTSTNEMRISSQGLMSKYLGYAFSVLKQEPDHFKVIARGMAVKNAELLLSKL